MKIIELEIKNVRGIRHLKLEQSQRNFVVYGPNGSGKSAVVDSIDFLLTGNISRLTGEGTGNISLRRHGPHINHQPDEAEVRGVIKLPNIADPIELSRCMGEPSKLIYDESLKNDLEPILDIAGQRQYILTRRDILRYITTNPSTRAQQIQELLNIKDIEETRKNLVSVKNKLKNDLETTRKYFNDVREDLLTIMPVEQFSEGQLLEFINQNRSILGGNPLSSLEWEKLKEGINLVAKSTKLSDNDLRIFRNSLKSIMDILSEANQLEIERVDTNLRKMIKEIKDNSQLLSDFARLRLTEMGLELIDDTGDCPLCDTTWPPGELETYLKERLSSIKDTELLVTDIRKLSNKLDGYFSKAFINMQNIIKIIQMAGSKDISELGFWREELIEFLNVLKDPIDHYIDSKFTREKIKSILIPDDLPELLDDYQQSIENQVVILTPEQAAWDYLTRLGEHLKRYTEMKNSLDSALRSYQKAEIILNEFIEARDRILGGLYEKIKNRFIDFYKELHGDDEKDFTAILLPEGAGLNFEVDFYGKGTHPPHALHSEGHQDSMGLCLYLALAEEINKDLINLIILDDVVMSVDSDHRKALCNTLNKYFPDWQFLITTHDKTWTNQLKSEGVVKSKNLIEFYNWNIQTGPLYMDYKADMWDQINESLTNRDIPNAAFRLRRGLEQFFGIVCNELQAPVTYRLSGRHELGDFLKAAMNKYKTLLKKAKQSANSWNNSEKLEELNVYESEVNQIYTRTNAERWAVNASVHYNSWPQLTENDFRPVIDAFNDLCQLFLCSNCGGIKHVLTDLSLRETTVFCNCGEFNWNLLKK